MMLGGRSVLITGGAGFIGSHLVDRLVEEEPAKLVVVDNLFLGKESNLEGAARARPDLRLYVQDAADYDAMGKILSDEGIEVVFDLGVVPLPTSLIEPKWTVDENVGMATTLAELLRQGAYRTLVHFSSSEVYGTAGQVPMDEDHDVVPLTPYAASKAAADHVVLSYHRTFGVDARVLRPFNTFGPRQNSGTYAGVIPQVLDRALAGMPVTVHGDGNQTRDFTFVEDIVEAAVLVYEHPETRGLVVNAARGEEVSVNTLVAELLDIAGTPVDVVHGPPRLGDVRRHVGCSARLTGMTGWKPEHDLRSGLEQTVAWYRTALGAPAVRGG